MTTPLDALITAFRAASDYDPRAETRPEALLWCDPTSDFAPLLPSLRRRLPHLFTLGEHDAALRQGPSVWMRAAIGHALPEFSWPRDEPAILYLPGVTREALRAAEDCPPHLQLLAWLAVGGASFAHPNGRDWTLRGYLATKPANGGLGLAVPQDDATSQALGRAAPKLAAMDLTELEGKRLDAAWLNALLAPDLNEDMLAWLDGTLDAEADPIRFAAFRERARAELKLDPLKVTRERAAQRLLRRQDGWAPVWSRFVRSAPGVHDSIIPLLAGQDPPDLLNADPAVYLSVNSRKEAELRAELLALVDEPDPGQAVYDLAREHESRRDGPWSARGLAPLASAVAHLAEITVTPPLTASEPEALAEAYARDGWRADWAALEAVNAASPGIARGSLATAADDRAAVVAALRVVYLPRLQREAEVLQELLRDGVPGPRPLDEADTLLFVDGLRMDLAHQLAAMLQNEGASVEVTWRWSGFPTVTATCKPLASPVAARFRGTTAEGFAPLTSDGRPVGKPELMRELAAHGWRAESSLLPAEKCWLETGHIDQDGHSLQGRLPDQFPGALHPIVAEIVSLARSGRRVRVITDHGWLLMPGGLPVARLGAGLTETLWSRCALVKEGSANSARQVPWSWNKMITVATAPGAHVFRGGTEYAHGGISPQECVVPELFVAPMQAARRAVIINLEWRGLRLRVRADGGDGLSADLWLGADGEGRSIADRPRQLDADGHTGLLVPDDLLEGQQALLTLRDQQEKLVASKATVVGG